MMFVLVVLALATIVVILALHQVDTRVTAEDAIYIERFLKEGQVKPLPTNPTYEEELEFTLSVQRAVQAIAGSRVDGQLVEIPIDRSREPKDLYHARSSRCFDMSRTIEKIFRASGFKTRHIFIFTTPDPHAFIRTVLSPQVSDSHAATEVLTQRGWLVVDSVFPWISLDEAGDPVSLDRIHGDLVPRQVRWHPCYPPSVYKSYNENFVYIYGLYSRHGRFFPPYDFIPDVNWREMLAHFDLD